MSTRERYVSELEALLDGGHTIDEVVGMLAEVCELKAEHVAFTSSQFSPHAKEDKALAAAWRRGALILTSCCATLARNPRIRAHKL